MGESEIQALTAQQIVDGILQWDERANAGDEAAAAGSSAPAAIGGSTGSISSSLSLMGKVRYSSAQISAVLSLLCDECHFLIPKTDTAAAFAASSADSPLIAGSDAILAAIGCDDCEDIDELCSLFYSSPADATINIDRNDVSAVVKEFVLHRQASGGRERGGAGGADGEAAGGSSVQSEKAARKREKERRYWEAMGRVVSEQSLDTWAQLESWLVKYNAVLKDRRGLAARHRGHQQAERRAQAAAGRVHEGQDQRGAAGAATAIPRGETPTATGSSGEQEVRPTCLLHASYMSKESLLCALVSPLSQPFAASCGREIYPDLSKASVSSCRFAWAG